MSTLASTVRESGAARRPNIPASLKPLVDWDRPSSVYNLIKTLPEAPVVRHDEHQGRRDEDVVRRAREQAQAILEGKVELRAPIRGEVGKDGQPLRWWRGGNRPRATKGQRLDTIAEEEKPEALPTGKTPASSANAQPTETTPNRRTPPKPSKPSKPSQPHRRLERPASKPAGPRRYVIPQRRAGDAERKERGGAGRAARQISQGRAPPARNTSSPKTAYAAGLKGEGEVPKAKLVPPAESKTLGNPPRGKDASGALENLPLGALTSGQTGVQSAVHSDAEGDPARSSKQTFASATKVAPSQDQNTATKRGSQVLSRFGAPNDQIPLSPMPVMERRTSNCKGRIPAHVGPNRTSRNNSIASQKPPSCESRKTNPKTSSGSLTISSGGTLVDEQYVLHGQGASSTGEDAVKGNAERYSQPVKAHEGGMVRGSIIMTAKEWLGTFHYCESPQLTSVRESAGQKGARKDQGADAEETNGKGRTGRKSEKISGNPGPVNGVRGGGKKGG